jgi:hypothetical protein
MSQKYTPVYTVGFLRILDFACVDWFKIKKNGEWLRVMLKKSLFFFGYILLQRYELAPLFAAPRKQYITLLSYIVSSRNRFLGGDKNEFKSNKTFKPQRSHGKAK